MKGGGLVRDVRVNVVAVAGMDGPDGFSAALGFQSLPRAGTGRAVTPVRGELKAMMMVDDLGKRFRVGLIPHEPRRNATAPRARPQDMRRPSALVQVDAVGNDGGE